MIFLLSLVEEVIVLKEKALTTERYVKLLDCIEGASAQTRERLADVYLGKSPKKGSTKIITVEEIKFALSVKNISLSGLKFQGNQVTVEFSDDVKEEENLTKIAISIEIKQYLKKTLGNDFNCRIVDIFPTDLPGDLQVMKIETKSEKPLGDMLFKLELSRGKFASVVVNVRQQRKALAASKTLQAGTVLTVKDFEWLEVEIDNESDLLTDETIILGGKTLKKIAKGEMLRAVDLKLKPIVKRNQLVRAKGKYVETMARSLQEGHLGQIIQCEFSATKTKFQGKIVGSDSVEIISTILNGDKK